MRFLPDLARRSGESELLDAPDLEAAELRVALRNVAQANSLFGGIRSLGRHLAPHAAAATAAGTALLFLDVGVGNGVASARVAERLGARWVGIDLSPTTLRVALAEPGSRTGRVGLVAGDAVALPFGDGSVDVATATLTLHHFPDEGCLRVLGEMARVARRGVIVSDLERRPLNWLGARLVGETLWRSDPLARNDAAVSVRRSFTMEELKALAERAGLRRIEVRRHFPFRIVLEARP